MSFISGITSIIFKVGLYFVCWLVSVKFLQDLVLVISALFVIGFILFC